MSDTPIPHLGAQFTDHLGRHYMEVPMPENHAYSHPLHSYGEARRLQVIDPKEKGRFTINEGYVTPSKKGTEGLIGYVDFYREPVNKKGFIFREIDEQGNEVKVDKRREAADTNIGFMNVQDKHKKTGVASEMFEYLDRTTRDDSKSIWVKPCTMQH